MTTPTMLIAPISGDPEQVRRVAAQLATVEVRALEIESRRRAIESGVGPQMWRGQAADGFATLLAETGPDLTRLAASYGAASQALTTYATELAAAQDTARAAEAEAATATADRDRATADRDRDRSDADRHAAAATDAQQRMDLAAAQDAEQRRTDALQRENAARATIEQADQALKAARQKADQAASQRDAAAARCVRELDDASGVGIQNRNLAQAPAAAAGPPPTAPADSNLLADIGHGILDVVGLVPFVGEAADGINAAWYAVEGDYANAALSAAATIPGFGAAATAAKLIAKGSEAARAAPHDWAQISGLLRDASRGKGNFGLGSGTAAQAETAGRAWVGEGYKIASDGKTLVSADVLRQYRPPSFKPRLGKSQANFESRLVPRGQWQSNGHLDIVENQ
jgi:hypothetical protein